MASMRSVVLGLALAAAVMPANAENWPTRPLTMVVSFPAGSGSDVLARILGARLSEILGQQVVIENVAGGGGMTAAYRVARAAPDGYQFVLGGTDTFAQSQTIYKKPIYNSVTDFVPVALLVEQPFLLVARNDLPAGNLAEFIAYAKANQAKMQYGSAGPASGANLTCTYLNAAMGVTVTQVPYRGAPEGLQDVIAGRIDYYCPVIAAAIGQIQNRTLKAIAILSRDRSPALPALASAHEQGLADFEATYWNGFFLPKGTPAAIVQKFHAASVATIDSPSVQERLKVFGLTAVAPDRRSPDYLKQFVTSEIKKWRDPIKATGVSLD
ncbi:MAG: tripartite tricarboxylate transporter substrate binding protein [Bradyrhizobiaceae bacterium]|nr:tripartite tricarboxylate transporter substrate binding protein [Bradyrhizobiaceae bacterium]